MVNNSTNINKTGKRPRQVLAWDRHTNVTVLNRLMGSQPLNKAEHSEVKFGNGKKKKIKS